MPATENRTVVYWEEDSPRVTGVNKETDQVTTVDIPIRRAAWLVDVRDGHCIVRLDTSLDPVSGDQHDTLLSLAPGTWSLTP